MNMSLTFKHASPFSHLSAYLRRRRQSLDRDSDSEVDDYDSETEMDENDSGSAVDDYEEYEADEDYDYFSHPPKHPRKWVGFPKLGCAVVIPIVLLLVVGATLFTDVQWLRSQTSSYQEIDGVTQVAQIHVVKTMEPHHMATQLILIDNKGHQYYDSNCKTCIIAGDNVLLRGDVITFSGWQNSLGLHPEFKLAMLKGHYADPAVASQFQPGVMSINGGDDNVFRSIQDRDWPFFGVAAAYTNTVTVPANGNTYDVFMSANGLYIRLSK